MPKSEREAGSGGHKSRKESRARNSHNSSSNHHASALEDDVKKPSLKSSDLFGSVLPPLSGPGASAEDAADSGLAAAGLAQVSGRLMDSFYRPPPRST